MLVLFLIPLLLFLLVALVIAATVLRTAIYIANRVLDDGLQIEVPADPFISSNSSDVPWWREEADVAVVSTEPTGAEMLNPYDAPQADIGGIALTYKRVIPEPGFSRALGISTLLLVVIFLLYVAYSTFLPDAHRVLNAVVVISWGLVAITTYALMLPTTFARAALICVLSVLVVVAVFAVLVGVMMAIS